MKESGNKSQRRRLEKTDLSQEQNTVETKKAQSSERCDGHDQGGCLRAGLNHMSEDKMGNRGDGKRTDRQKERKRSTMSNKK